MDRTTEAENALVIVEISTVQMETKRILAGKQNLVSCQTGDALILKEGWNSRKTGTQVECNVKDRDHKSGATEMRKSGAYNSSIKNALQRLRTQRNAECSRRNNKKIRRLENGMV